MYIMKIYLKLDAWLIERPNELLFVFVFKGMAYDPLRTHLERRAAEQVITLSRFVLNA